MCTEGARWALAVRSPGGAPYAQVGPLSLVDQEQVQRGEPGFDWHDIGWSAGETVFTPSLDPVQEGH